MVDFVLVNSVCVFLENENLTEVSVGFPCTGSKAVRGDGHILSKIGVGGETAQNNVETEDAAAECEQMRLSPGIGSTVGSTHQKLAILHVDGVAKLASLKRRRRSDLLGKSPKVGTEGFVDIDRTGVIDRPCVCARIGNSDIIAVELDGSTEVLVTA